MYTILVVTLVLVSIALVALILIQHGKGADAGAAFGSGASGTVFGARGSATFLSRATAWLAAAFFAITLVLAYLANHRDVSGTSVVDRMQNKAAPATAATAAKSVMPKLVVPAAGSSSAAAAPAAATDADRTGAPGKTAPASPESATKAGGAE